MIDTHLHLSHHLFDAQFPYLARNSESSYTIQQGTRKDLIGKLLSAGVCVRGRGGASHPYLEIQNPVAGENLHGKTPLERAAEAG